MPKPDEQRSSKTNAIRDAYLQRFGELMTSDEVRLALKFNSLSALSMARRRGHIPLGPIRVEGRRTLMYSTNEVCNLLNKWAGNNDQPTPEKETTPQ